MTSPASKQLRHLTRSAQEAKAKLERGLMWRGDIIWIRTDPVTGKARSTGCHDPRAARNWRAERERLATDPRYAPALHQHARPLGGMADAGDLKGHLAPSARQHERVYGVPNGRDRAHSGPVRVTPALHGAGALTRAGLIDPRDRLRLGFAAFRVLGAA